MNTANEFDRLSTALKSSGVGYWSDAIYHVVYSRAQFRCEYCDFDLMSSLSAYIGFWQLDHILPQARYPLLGGPSIYKYGKVGTSYLNLALTCRACNGLKSDFDPGIGLIDHTATDISPELRRQLVDRARVHIGRLREPKQRDYDAILRLLKSHYQDVPYGPPT